MTQTPDTPPLLEFPCRFPIKIMGAAHPEFTRTVLEVTRIHAPDFEEVDLVVRESSGGSAGNTCAVAASLGARVAYIGKVADDHLGPGNSGFDHVFDFAGLHGHGRSSFIARNAAIKACRVP